MCNLIYMKTLQLTVIGSHNEAISLTPFILRYYIMALCTLTIKKLTKNYPHNTFMTILLGLLYWSYTAVLFYRILCNNVTTMDTIAFFLLNYRHLLVTYSSNTYQLMLLNNKQTISYQPADTCYVTTCQTIHSFTISLTPSMLCFMITVC